MIRFLALSLAVLLLPPAALAQVSTPTPAPTATGPIAIATNRLDTMLRTGHADPSWFSASFLAQVPVSKVDDVIKQTVASVGDYRSLEFTPSRFIAHFEKGTDDILIHLDADNKIDGLLFKTPVASPHKHDR